MTAGESYRSWDDRDATYASQRPSFSPPSTSQSPPPAGKDTFWQRATRKRKDLPVWKETLIFVVIAFFIAVLVRTFLFQAYYIPSSSMENTIQIGDRVLISKVTYDFRGPQRGEVVVFKGPASWPPETVTDDNASMFSRIGSGLGNIVGISQPGRNDFIKRVIGLPGDTVACCDSSGRITVNGVGIDEPYVTANAPIVDTTPSTPSCADRNFRPVVVQPGMVFVMGDRRLVSQDSRCNGQVPISNIIGKADAIIWPTSRWSSFGIPAGFKNVPPPEAGGPTAPVRIPLSGGPVVVFPLLSAFGLLTRSGREWRVGRRRLRA